MSSISLWKKSNIAAVVLALFVGSGATAGITSLFLGRNPTVLPLPASSTSTATKVGDVIMSLPLIAKASATGGTVKTTGMDGKAGAKYAAICIAQPLNNVGFGSGGTTVGRNSGSILELTYHVVKNHRGVGGDIGFVRDCNSDGSGQTLLNDVCTATGCTSKFVVSGNNGDWSGDLKLKAALAQTQEPAREPIRATRRTSRPERWTLLVSSHRKREKQDERSSERAPLLLCCQASSMIQSN